MQGKIAFEEHMAIPETVAQARSFAADSGRWDDFALQLTDVGARRDAPCAERPARPSLPPNFTPGGGISSAPCRFGGLPGLAARVGYAGGRI